MLPCPPLRGSAERLTLAGDVWQGPVMKAARLSDRGVIRVAGDEARKFLNGLVTADMSQMQPARARYAALLTPQGKIIVDFIAVEATAADGGGFFLDCPRARSAALLERLKFYRLRAKVAIEDVSEASSVMAFWDGASLRAPPGVEGLCYPDPRLPELGLRAIVPAGGVMADLEMVAPAQYEAHRIMLGVPQGGTDFGYEDAFPHEADMDQLNGIDFQKGCFVGQEVVSRMEHRGSTRTRVIPVAFAGLPPAPGTAVTAGGRPLGTIGSAAGGRGLAALRLDRIEEALASGTPLAAGETTLKPVKPAWARFPFPGGAKAAE
jgi:tRNA-modifying protein YgfZ